MKNKEIKKGKIITNTNNNTNQASLATNQLLNKKRAYTPFTPYTPIMNNNA